MASATPPGRAVVTGGAGAIGGVLVASLLQRGVSVTVIDNLSSGRLENLSAVHAHPGFRFVKGDLLHADLLAPAFRGATELWHLAANPDIRRGTENPRLDLEQGTMATFNALEAARAAGIQRIRFSSSSVVYGFPEKFPTPEEYGPLLPQSQYAAGKLGAEGLVSAFCHSYGMRSCVFRFANIIGPGMTHGIIFDFLKKIEKDPKRLEVLGDGRQRKSYLWTQDCVDGMLLASERSGGPIEIFNLGSNDQISAMEIAQKVVAALGVKARIETTGGPRGWVGDVPQQFLATERIRALGWKPRFNSAEAVDRAIPLVRAEVGI
ncbi:MAG TPA: NAD-dependent epimerase/dehydratase family protein [Thermoplasmata archaeon]|nr:NAD-dependent epimerase/dehydratase family protein [Thermoplasmata archaeon]